MWSLVIGPKICGRFVHLTLIFLRVLISESRPFYSVITHLLATNMVEMESLVCGSVYTGPYSSSSFPSVKQVVTPQS